MICSRQTVLIGWIALTLAASCLAADLFPTETRRQAFLRALAKQDATYDPNEKMLRTAFSSPGYHTTLTDGTVHRTRNSLEYAVALLDSGDPNRAERARQVLGRVIALQDQDPSSRTYGIWSWFLEEPLDQMSPPDWNWADFCGTQLLQVAIDHMDRLPADLQQQVRDSILHAARSIQRRNVGPGYTNIALMGTYVTLVTGERFDVPDLLNYGKARLRRFYDHTQEKGSFSEYNSPTYTLVAIDEISRMLQHVRDNESKELLRELNEFAWRHVARRFHPPTKQWSGPHSRSYATLLRSSALAFIQRATDGEVTFLPETEAWESIDAHRIALKCPEDLFHSFTRLDTPRQEVEAFVRNAGAGHDIIGTTYLHPEFALGSVNIGDLWNQRRPVIAYWNTSRGPAALRLRCLHDDYDYASASTLIIQDKGDLLAAVLFATDRGDTHISLDRLRNATIRAGDMRVRLQFEGAISDLDLPEQIEMGEPIQFTSGRICASFYPAHAVFDDYPISLESGSAEGEAWVDIVLYHGMEREFDFSRIKEAAVVFTLSMTTAAPPTIAKPTVFMTMAGSILAGGRLTPTREKWQWQRTNEQTLALTIPAIPLPTSEQNEATEARLGSANPWKASH